MDLYPIEILPKLRFKSYVCSLSVIRMEYSKSKKVRLIQIIYNRYSFIYIDFSLTVSDDFYLFMFCNTTSNPFKHGHVSYFLV